MLLFADYECSFTLFHILTLATFIHTSQIVAELSQENRQLCEGLMENMVQTVVSSVAHRTDGKFEMMQAFTKHQVRCSLLAPSRQL
jgi:hypothetical protein